MLKAIVLQLREHAGVATQWLCGAVILWWCWEFNQGSCACWASPLPLSYSSSPRFYSLLWDTKLPRLVANSLCGPNRHWAWNLPALVFPAARVAASATRIRSHVTSDNAIRAKLPPRKWEILVASGKMIFFHGQPPANTLYLPNWMKSFKCGESGVKKRGHVSGQLKRTCEKQGEHARLSYDRVFIAKLFICSPEGREASDAPASWEPEPSSRINKR